VKEAYIYLVLFSLPRVIVVCVYEYVCMCIKVREQGRRIGESVATKGIARRERARIFESVRKIHSNE